MQNWMETRVCGWHTLVFVPTQSPGEAMNANPHQQVNTEARCLYIALELSSETWKIASTDRMGRRPRLVNLKAGDLKGLTSEIDRSKARFELPADAAVVSCYEAGRDGFWLHRCLVSLGIRSHIVEPASLQVNRRQRRAKTDRIDAEKIVTALIRFEAGDRFACRMVRVPDKQIEDARHLHRELKSLKCEHTSHRNRIQGLLVACGCRDAEVNARFPSWLKHARGGDGELLGRRLVERLQREFERLQLVTEQIRQLQKEQYSLIRQAAKQVDEGARCQGTAGGPSDRPTGEDRIVAIAEHLIQLRGIGVVSSWTLSAEIFAWRDIRNRRQLAALVGLVPTPHASGSEEKEQGISKSGRSDLRVLMIEIAWLWLHYQPQSDLAKWYQRRFGGGTARERKRGIVALARKLLVALGKYAAEGQIPAGADIGKSLSTNYTPSLGRRTTTEQLVDRSASAAAA